MFLPREELFDKGSSTAEMASSNVMVVIGMCKGVNYFSFGFLHSRIFQAQDNGSYMS